jgi:alkylation response protein AidB-like acyl-CoA dehydrogenase
MMSVQSSLVITRSIAYGDETQRKKFCPSSLSEWSGASVDRTDAGSDPGTEDPRRAHRRRLSAHRLEDWISNAPSPTCFDVWAKSAA